MLAVFRGLERWPVRPCSLPSADRALLAHELDVLLGLLPAIPRAPGAAALGIALATLFRVATLGAGRMSHAHVFLLRSDQSGELFLLVEEMRHRPRVPLVGIFFLVGWGGVAVVIGQTEPQATEVVFLEDIQLVAVKRILEDLIGGDVLTAVAVDHHATTIELTKDNARGEGQCVFGMEGHVSLLCCGSVERTYGTAKY